jgi:hypothetical protein
MPRPRTGPLAGASASVVPATWSPTKIGSGGNRRAERTSGLASGPCHGRGLGAPNGAASPEVTEPRTPQCDVFGVGVRLVNFRNYVFLAIRRSEPVPQNVTGIFCELGAELGVHSEADQGKFPTLEELSTSLKDLIESGRIVEMSPHRYREATYGSVARNFSGVSLDEYEKGRTAYFHRLIQELTRGWTFDPSEWPGPDRVRWGMGMRSDVVVPSPDGQFACVRYSCAQITYVWTVGLLALLKGPPERPTIILRPLSFSCSSDHGHVQWLEGSRYCAVVPVLYNSAMNRIELLAITFLDLVDETYTHYEPKDILKLVGAPIISEGDHWIIRGINPKRPGEAARIDPRKLEWHSWHSLKGLPEWRAVES